MHVPVKSLLVAFLVLLPVLAPAQTCAPATGSHEADLFAIRSLSLAMSRGAAPNTDGRGTVRAGVEAVWLPDISDETATPTTCRPGKGPENVNALPAAARLRASIVLPWQFTLEASWLPPVTLKGMQGNILGVALAHSNWLTTHSVLSLRAHATVGHVKGPFTCSADAVKDATLSNECYQGTISSDQLSPNIFGGDAAFGWTPGTHYSWYAGAGYSRLSPRFRVHFLNRFDVLDTTRVTVDLNRVAMFGGVSRTIGAAWRASGEVYATPRDGATARVVFDRVLHRGK